ncbi:hypothetical protein [Nocardia nepalensis]|uniref:hypothetical protein n=1 Tax=Nocardia nepalensis TaxID=3375448 RepID=UPI003B67B619
MNMPDPAVCPNESCGYTTTTAVSERGWLLGEIKVIWLEPANDGGLFERRHSQRCRSRDLPIDDVECAVTACGGPQVTGVFATELLDTGELPLLVRRWLAVCRWHATPAVLPGPSATRRGNRGAGT